MRLVLVGRNSMSLRRRLDVALACEAQARARVVAAFHDMHHVWSPSHYIVPKKVVRPLVREYSTITQPIRTEAKAGRWGAVTTA